MKKQSEKLSVKEYPYIEKKCRPNPLTHIHLNENLFIEINPQASPSIAIVKRKGSSEVESLTFESCENDCSITQYVKDRELYGRVDLKEPYNVDIRFYGQCFVADKLTLSEVLDGYYRYRKIKDALNEVVK